MNVESKRRVKCFPVCGKWLEAMANIHPDFHKLGFTLQQGKVFCSIAYISLNTECYVRRLMMRKQLQSAQPSAHRGLT